MDQPLERKAAAPVILVARVYDPPETLIGARILMDRLWPRGISKAALALDDWPKALTPSNDLRRWLHADPTRWEAFKPLYLAEIASHPLELERCLDRCRKGPVVLLTAAQNRDANHATILRDLLLERLGEESQ